METATLFSVRRSQRMKNVIGFFGLDAQMGYQSHPYIARQWKNAVAVALGAADGEGAGSPVNVIATEVGDLSQPQTKPKKQEQQYSVPQIAWLAASASRNEGADLPGRKGEFWGDGLGTGAFISSFLLLIPLVFAAIPLCLMVANCVGWCILPARRAFDREAQAAPWLSFRVAMSQYGSSCRCELLKDR